VCGNGRHLQIPLSLPKLALVEEGTCNVL
jgi:hypothetical protein